MGLRPAKLHEKLPPGDGALRGLTRLPWISGAFCRKFAGSPVCLRFPGPAPRIGFSPLLGWAFGPRNSMKNRCPGWGMLKLASRPQAGRAAGFSPLFEWAFRPRNPMKNRAPRDLVGRTPGPRGTPRPAAGPTVLASCRAPKADEGVPRGPGGPLPSRFFDSVGMGVPPAKLHEKPMP